MNGVTTQEYKGKRIIVLDFEGITLTAIPRLLEIVATAKKIIATHPENSVLTLTKMAGVPFNSVAIDAVKEMAKVNKPYVKKAAVIGLKRLQLVAYNVITRYSGRDIKAFASAAEAMDWLAE